MQRLFPLLDYVIYMPSGLPTQSISNERNMHATFVAINETILMPFILLQLSEDRGPLLLTWYIFHHGLDK